MLAANVYVINNTTPALDISAGLSNRRYNMYIKTSAPIALGDSTVTYTTGLGLVSADGIRHFAIDHDALYIVTNQAGNVTVQVLTAEA
jgi:hypothetical protein